MKIVSGLFALLSAFNAADVASENNLSVSLYKSGGSVDAPRNSQLTVDNSQYLSEVILDMHHILIKNDEEARIRDEEARIRDEEKRIHDEESRIRQEKMMQEMYAKIKQEIKQIKQEIKQIKQENEATKQEILAMGEKTEKNLNQTEEFVKEQIDSIRHNVTLEDILSDIMLYTSQSIAGFLADPQTSLREMCPTLEELIFFCFQEATRFVLEAYVPFYLKQTLSQLTQLVRESVFPHVSYGYADWGYDLEWYLELAVFHPTQRLFFFPG